MDDRAPDDSGTTIDGSGKFLIHWERRGKTVTFGWEPIEPDHPLETWVVSLPEVTSG